MVCVSSYSKAKETAIHVKGQLSTTIKLVHVNVPHNVAVAIRRNGMTIQLVVVNAITRPSLAVIRNTSTTTRIFVDVHATQSIVLMDLNKIRRAVCAVAR